MPYTTPTVSDFKAQFARDFPYAVPAFGAAGRVTLTGGVVTVVSLLAGGRGYLTPPAVALIDKAGAGAVVTATIASGAVTGFAVGAGGTGYVAPTLNITGGAGDESDKTRVQDADITGAIFDASFNVNQQLFGDQAHWGRAFLYLTAHNLVERLRAAGEGVRSQFSWLIEDKGVADVKVKYSIPPNILKNPFLASISTTRYGARYLEIVTPLLCGNMMTMHRRTIP